MIYIWIRHGRKLYCNGKGQTKGQIRGHNHDPPLIKNEKYRIKSLRKKIIERYGQPELIITSPFLRCRETASFLRKKEPVVIDCFISEYLGNQKGDMDLSETTKSFGNFSCDETIDDLNERVNDHLNNLFKSVNRRGVTWIVTHGIIINRIHQLFSENSYFKFTELGGLVLDDKEVVLFECSQPSSNPKTNDVGGQNNSK